MVAEPSALPCDDGVWPDEDENVPPASPGPGQPRPEKAIGDLDARSRRTPLVDGELVAQREGLELQGGPRSEAGAERGEEGEEDFLVSSRSADRATSGSESGAGKRPVRRASK